MFFLFFFNGPANTNFTCGSNFFHASGKFELCLLYLRVRPVQWIKKFFRVSLCMVFKPAPWFKSFCCILDSAICTHSLLVYLKSFLSPNFLFLEQICYLINQALKRVYLHQHIFEISLPVFRIFRRTFSVIFLIIFMYYYCHI